MRSEPPLRTFSLVRLKVRAVNWNFRKIAPVFFVTHKKQFIEAFGQSIRCSAMRLFDAKLDLHGHTRESGRQALTGFLRAHRAAGRRCVLVVTGKGLKDDWSVGALRQALPDWLNAPDLRRLILAFCHAQPQHGGSGAVYILLRRERGKGAGREGD